MTTAKKDPRDKGRICGVCGRRYKLDIMLPNQMWQKINPEGHEFICGRCILRRIEASGRCGAYTLRPAHEDFAMWNAMMNASKHEATADSIGKVLK